LLALTLKKIAVYSQIKSLRDFHAQIDILKDKDGHALPL